MIRSVLVTACLVWLESGAASAQAPAPSAITAIRPPQPIAFSTPARFWRFGKPSEESRGLVLRVRPANPFAFLPRDMPTPLFMYGRSPCSLLRNPAIDGEATVLCPLLAPGDPAIVWVVVVAGPDRLTREVTEKALRSVTGPRSRATFPVPGERIPEKTVRDPDELRRSLEEPPEEKP
jgi:hypothetical protein